MLADADAELALAWAAASNDVAVMVVTTPLEVKVVVMVVGPAEAEAEAPLGVMKLVGLEDSESVVATEDDASCWAEVDSAAAAEEGAGVAVEQPVHVPVYDCQGRSAWWASTCTCLCQRSLTAAYGPYVAAQVDDCSSQLPSTSATTLEAKSAKTDKVVKAYFMMGSEW